jgi:hypothetical protein
MFEEIIKLNDLINSSEADHICLYSTVGQDLTLLETMCVCLCISSKDIIEITLFTD